MQIKKTPLEGGGDSSIFPSVLCRGQCRDEQEEEYREIFHELRNSLTGIILGLGNIEHHWNHLTLSEVMRSIQHLKEMAMFMGDLMNRHNLPGLSGEGLLSSEELDLTIVVAQAVKNNIIRAAVKDITLTFHPLVLSTIILGDRLAILQIAENLLSNAIKFSPRHSSVDVFVAVSTSAAASLQNSEHWEIPLEENEAIRFVRMEVHDKGPGVTLEDKDHLFERNARLSARPTNGESSTGIGLSIVKKMTEATGGQVWCESSPEQGIQGSKFIVEFPLLKEM